jgi:beta-glucanase (GH16 family)
MRPSSCRCLLTAASLLVSWMASVVLTQTIVWSDEFDSEGSPNSTHWGYDVGDWGWGNQELQNYTNNSMANAFVHNGSLHIVAIRNADNTFTSARLKTDDKVYIKYGTIVARINVPNVANGLWPAFWTLGQNFKTAGWPVSGEIDIMEIGDGDAIDQGVANRRVQSSVHWQRANGDVFYEYAWADPPYDLNASFHLYKLEWTPDFVRMWVDDVQTYYYNISMDSCIDCGALHQPHYLILNLAVGGDFTYRTGEPWGAARITATLPATMEVDYVRVYENGWTQVSGPGVMPQSSTKSPIHGFAPTPTMPPSLPPATSRPLPTNTPSDAPPIDISPSPSADPTNGATSTASLTETTNSISPTGAPTKMIPTIKLPTVVSTEMNRTFSPTTADPIPTASPSDARTKTPVAATSSSIPTKDSTPAPSIRMDGVAPTLDKPLTSTSGTEHVWKLGVCNVVWCLGLWGLFIV